MRGLLLILVLLAIAPGHARAGDDGLEFYEKKIRPLFAEHCVGCHGPKKQRSGLRVDSLAALRKGGDHGPAVVPKNASASVLLKAVSYQDNDLRMPPKGKLSDDQLKDLAIWIERGAPAPADAVDGAPVAKEFNLAERRQHWCYQPLRMIPLPDVSMPAWTENKIDQYVLARMEQAGLSPAPPADKRIWLRRVTFDLIGLPPTGLEINAFLADESADAHARVVDRLLASPHYGERWARHWLDLVRYAETLGHEFDYDLPNAWRYRDYVIRALNGDLPYHRFVVEHLAGDLLATPRRHPTEGYNESIIATGFWWLGEGKHGPVDVRQEQAERIDNQIDVFGKAFLAQTIACARCHDHKFDAISTRDYYALFGYLKSSRYQQAFLDHPDRFREPLAEVAKAQAELHRLATERVKSTAGSLASYLLATHALLDGQGSSPDRIATLARERGLNADLLAQWTKLLQLDQVKNPGHPLFAWMRLAGKSPDVLGEQQQAARLALEQATKEYDSKLAGFPLLADVADPAQWSVTGQAFVPGPSKGGEFVWLDNDQAGLAQFLPKGVIHSGRLSSRVFGVLRSPTFTLGQRFLHVQAAGRGTRVNVVVDGFTIIRDPIYGGLTLDLKDDRLAWRTFDVGAWQGHRAYLEFQDDKVPHVSMGEMKGDYLAIAAIRASDVPGAPPEAPHPLNRALLGHATSIEALASAYAECLTGDLAVDAVELANFLLANKLWPGSDEESQRQTWRRAVEALRAARSELPLPLRAPAMADGTGEDERVFLRGNHKTPGAVAPRGLPVVFAGENQPAPKFGSGRLELAERLIQTNQAQLARVLVNRLWHHYFGRGIVATPDDFGRMGALPTHPQLFDYLASEFIRQGWSLKKMHRLIVLSNTYRQASKPSTDAERTDPQNQLWSHFPVRRLEGETIRDAMLATSGRLDRTPYGPGVMPYLTSFMEGRGRPGESGPLDGQGRRSIYLGVRRNFLNPMFLAFDYPVPFTTIGRRTVSNVPAQALTLLNDPFVLQQARLWAERTLRDQASADARIKHLYLSAFAREPDAAELADAMRFLDDQARRLGKPSDDLAVWTDLCHVLFNVKELVFVR